MFSFFYKFLMASKYSMKQNKGVSHSSCTRFREKKNGILNFTVYTPHNVKLDVNCTYMCITQLCSILSTLTTSPTRGLKNNVKSFFLMLQ